MYTTVNLKRLQKNCEITLERFMEYATETCAILSRLRALPVSKDKRLEVLLQQRREDEAFEAYHKARVELLTVIKRDLELVETGDEPEQTRTFGTPRVGDHRRRAG
jgi:hypothetical protein